MYMNTARVEYLREAAMDIEKAVSAGKSAGGEACVFCGHDLHAGDRVVVGEHRIGGKTFGKTIRVESCLACAKILRDLIDLRIAEAEKLA